MKRLAGITALLCALGLAACEPCESISAEEACARLTAAMEQACGKSATSSEDPCDELYKTDAPLNRCASDDRFCAADVDSAAATLAQTTDCQGGPRAILVNCFPE